ARLPPWPDPRTVQRFVRVDLAAPDNQAAVHQQLFDRDLAAACDAPHIVGVELVGEGLRGELREERMLVRIAGDVMRAAEAAWIVEPEQAPGIQKQADVV